MGLFCYIGLHHWHRMDGDTTWFLSSWWCKDGIRKHYYMAKCCRCQRKRWKRYVLNY